MGKGAVEQDEPLDFEGVASVPHDHESALQSPHAAPPPAEAESIPIQLKLSNTLGALSKGPSAQARTSIEHISEGRIAYLVGKHVALFSYETMQHRFIFKQSRTADIVTFAVTANRKYIALSEKQQEDKGGGGTEVSVWCVKHDKDLTGVQQEQPKKVRVLSFSYLSKQPAIALGFSRDNKYLAAATMPPEGYLSVWQLDKSPCRLIAMAEIQGKVTQVSVSPWCSTTFCTTGTSMIRIWKLASPHQLKPFDPMAKRREYRYTCHSWFDDDRVLAGTMEGDIIVIENCEVKRVLQAVHVENHAIWCIACVARGFVCAGDGGYVSLFERTFDGDCFHVYKTFQVKHKRIIELSVSPNEENVVLLSENNEMVLFSLANIDILEPDEGAAFRPLAIGFHADTVTSVDVCIQRSIVVTASMDHHVRVWNFLRKRVEVNKQFDEEVAAVACHPSGLRLMLAFKHHMAMFCILLDDLHQCHEFRVKHCKEIRFSQGGQFFAAAVVTKIFVYNSYNFNCIGFLTGHSSMVKSLCWTQNDTCIVSAGFEGAIYEWKVETCKKIDRSDIITKALAYSCVRYDDETRLVAAIGSNKMAESGLQEGEVTLRTFLLPEDRQEKGKERPVAPPLGQPILLGSVQQHKHAHNKTHTAECAISLTHKCLFVGTSSGQLLVYHWPMRENEAPFIRMEVHQGEVLFVVLSFDERCLFTIGEDMSLFMFDITALHEKRIDPDKRLTPFNYGALEDVVYVLQKDLDEKAEQIASLVEQNQQLEFAQEQEVERLKTASEKALREKREQTEQLINERQERMKAAQLERDQIQQMSRQREEENERLHMKAAEDLETMYNSRTEAMEKKYQQAKDDKDDMIVRYENKMHQLKKEWEKERGRMKQELATLEERMKGEIDKLQKERQDLKDEMEDMLDQCEKEYEEEIHGIKQMYMLEKERKDAQFDKDVLQWTIGLRTQEKNSVEIEKLQRDLQAREDLLHRAKLKNTEHEKANDALRLEIDVRIDTITSSERKILELRKQTAELEKLRYVLTFKFNELRKEVAPKEEQIRIMEERMREMDVELERIRHDGTTLRQALCAKDDKIDVIKSEIQSRVELLDMKDQTMKSLLHELREVADHAEPKRLIYNLRDVILRYTDKQAEYRGSSDRAAVHEFHRQRVYMEKQLDSMIKQNERRETNLQQDNQRKTVENAMLVREINDLRHEKKLILAKVQHIEEQVKEAHSQIRGSVGPPQPFVAKTAKTKLPPATPARPAGVKRTGKLFRGTTRSVLDLMHMDAARIAEVIHQIERNNMELAQQQSEVNQLREFVAHLLSRLELDKKERDEKEMAIRAHLAATQPREESETPELPDIASASSPPPVQSDTEREDTDDGAASPEKPSA